MEKKLLSELKFHFIRNTALYFRSLVRSRFNTIREADYDALVLLPSHKRKESERPFHPCKFISRILKKEFRIHTIYPVEKKSSELQSSKGKIARYFHARFAFLIRKEWKNKLQGRYLLLDDVFTTGASVNEVARLLKENGAERVDVLTLLRTRPED